MPNIIKLVIKVVYQRLKNLREDRDWTQQALADRLHISRSTYSAYENGANSVPIPILIQLAQIFGTSVDYLLEQTDELTPYPRRRKQP